MCELGELPDVKIVADWLSAITECSDDLKVVALLREMKLEYRAMLSEPALV